MATPTVPTTEAEIIDRLKTLSGQAARACAGMIEVRNGKFVHDSEKRMATSLEELFKSQYEDLDKIIQGYAQVAASQNPSGIKDILDSLAKRK